MQEYIKVRGAKEHNLKNINIDIPRNKFIVITGLSGSGKSSLAFDTIYAEGQRRYVESLSSYARQFLHLQNKPNVESISGLSPAIAIDQKTTSKNPRSTVGTITEIYDYLRLFYARVGVPYSPATGLPIKSQSISEMVDIINELPNGTKIFILSPMIRGQKGEFRREIANLNKHGYQRLYIDGELYNLSEMPKIDKNKKHNIDVVIDRLVISDSLGNRVAESLEASLLLGDGLTYIEISSLPEKHDNKYEKGERIILSEKYSCPESGFQLEEIEPRIFSFNSPFGACPACEGIGQEPFFDSNLIVPDETISIREGAIVPWSKSASKVFTDTLASLARHYNFKTTEPFSKLTEKVKNILFFGSGEEIIKFEYNDDRKKEVVEQVFAGIIPSLQEKYRRTDTNWMKEELERFMSKHNCSVCNGYRLKKESLCVKIDNLNIGEVSKKTIFEAQIWFNEINSKLSPKQQLIAERIIKEIQERLKFLNNVGLDYLSLSRESGTLSGGESQRIRLASQIGCGLSGVLYVLDEPSIGLHQRDNSRLITTLKNLRDLGNTVIVVEHDDETMLEAEHVIDVGPGAGIHGGQIIAQGTPAEIMQAEHSITGQYLSGRKYISLPKKTRDGQIDKEIVIKGADANNLQNLTLKIKLGIFTAITGVSGSGKSSLIIHTFYKAALKHLEPSTKIYPGKYDSISGLEHIDKIIDINQSPIGRTPRSNPATYTGAFTPIRDWFTELPESKIRGYKVGRFSFNVKGGRCEACQGDGLIKIEMHFLPDVYINCDVCGGKRYNRETLEVKYNGKNIADVLDMTVEKACEFFEKIPVIHEKLATLKEVGLGYIKIGQSATTLSGGEAQRVKLAKELSKRSTGKTLYILDEPTTGLHIDDIKKLLSVLDKLVEKGNTVVVIEHNMEVIKTADYIIDIGPEGGDKGGLIVVEGTPDEVAACDKSHTGIYLKHYIEQARKFENVGK
ncbi:MAG: excinuclease ABC subunit UvrA [Rickettsiales bacterium]|nr:MAG: excinuclease ABC subunit UvrA [Rickettsiales bacterium]